MIEITGLTKRYGTATALGDIDMTLADAGIYTLLGRNGAGKTTLMKLLAGHIPATSGSILLDGCPISPARMPEDVTFLENQSDQFNLAVGELVAAASRLQPGFDTEFADTAVHRLKLDASKRYRHLSFGMKTMLTAIIALASTSKVILLDEPTLGLDAIMREQFNQLLVQSFETHERLVIVSTHLIDEIAKVAQNLIVIDQGRILVDCNLDDVDERAYTLSGPVALVDPLVDGLNCIGKVQAGSVMAAHIYDRRVAVPDGVRVDRLGLQDFFINLVGGNTND